MEVKLNESESKLAAKSAQFEEKKLRIGKGGPPKYHQKLKDDKKLFARERLRLLLDSGFQLEDAELANCLDEELPADGVITGIGQVEGKTVCFMANDSTVKAGSWAGVP